MTFADYFQTTLQPQLLKRLQDHKVNWISVVYRHFQPEGDYKPRDKVIVKYLGALYYEVLGFDDDFESLQQATKDHSGSLELVSHPGPNLENICNVFRQPPTLGSGIGLAKEYYLGWGTLGGHIELKIKDEASHNDIWVTGAITCDHVINPWSYPAMIKGTPLENQVKPEQGNMNTFSPDMGQQSDAETALSLQLDLLGKTERTVTEHDEPASVPGGPPGKVYLNIGTLQRSIKGFHDTRELFASDLEAVERFRFIYFKALQGTLTKDESKLDSIVSKYNGDNDRHDKAVAFQGQMITLSQTINQLKVINKVYQEKDMKWMLELLQQVAHVYDDKDRTFGPVVYQSKNTVTQSDRQRVDWAFIRSDRDPDNSPGIEVGGSSLVGSNSTSLETLTVIQSLKVDLVKLPQEQRRGLALLNNDFLTPHTFGQMKEGITVVKRGIQTGTTFGTVSKLENWEDRTKDEGGPFKYWGVWNDQGFAEQGDSGSFVLDGDGRVVGILFGGGSNGKQGLVADINVVLRDLLTKSGATAVRLPGSQTVWQDPAPPVAVPAPSTSTSSSASSRGTSVSTPPSSSSSSSRGAGGGQQQVKKDEKCMIS